MRYATASSSTDFFGCLRGTATRSDGRLLVEPLIAGLEVALVTVKNAVGACVLDKIAAGEFVLKACCIPKLTFDSL